MLSKRLKENASHKTLFFNQFFSYLLHIDDIKTEALNSIYFYIVKLPIYEKQEQN